jgi:hypothetical protein
MVNYDKSAKIYTSMEYTVPRCVPCNYIKYSTDVDIHLLLVHTLEWNTETGFFIFLNM